MSDKRKSFAAYTPGEARRAASDWLRNFKEHGPLEIKNIKVAAKRDLFVATVAYAEMTVEATPQYFLNYQPILPSLLKSA
jgi:hypothetical protein